jgi:AmmeMemoRadiSam system protein A
VSIETEEIPRLSETNKRFLLDIARKSVENFVRGNPPEKFDATDDELRQRRGVFVTLKVSGELRGCIGHILSPEPLPDTTREMAIKSASQDPRFPPITRSELENLEIDISVMGPLVEVTDIDDIVIGRDGLVVDHMGRHGLLLPQVAVEHNFNVEQFLSQTCLKAMLPADTWKYGAKIFRFAAIVF